MSTGPTSAGVAPAAREAAAPPLLSMRGISKAFLGVPVLRDVSFEVRPGEAHVLAGENGAGKSTLIKIAAGVHTDYQGELLLSGRPVRFGSPQDAAAHGISVIHQEMSLIDAMSVVDNMFLGRELTRRGSAGQWTDRAAELRRARDFCAQLDLDIDLSEPVERYSLSVKNRIEIAKALAFDARILVMDEPTSALAEPEVDRLFEIVGQLKARGCGVVYITHRLEEIYRIADRITVLRDGRSVGTAARADLPEAGLIRWMIGRELSEHFPERRATPGAERLRIEGVSLPDPAAAAAGVERWLVRDASLSVRAGEIVGLAGLQGSGNSELLRGVFGAQGRLPRGRVLVDGRPLDVHSPQRSVAQGLAYLTSDRKGTGLVLCMDIAQNITLASLRGLSPAGWLSRRKEQRIAARHVDALSIRATETTQEVATLSGGNQQKVALAKWIETRPRVLLLDEPTRGVDVGAKHEIYELMGAWTRAGHAILLITSEMPELLGLCDRIVVMHRGRVTAHFARAEATQERILKAAMADTAA
ncbi:MAG TPA: sugar ABC transporter ATP-binding protein [Anaeromyxobacteraceae bacterium]|nr:sugar ABC transporter ATP-binding protein [Anaeromyxobacteraceae bacterium]